MSLELKPVEEKRPRQTILVVDDDVDQSDVLCHRLDHLGFKTRSAVTGQLGMSLARAEHPSLILLDVRLPDVDGLSVCRELVDDTATCDIPIIIVSGMEQNDIVRRSRAAGCRYYIRKPYDPNALLILIQQALNDVDDW